MPANRASLVVIDPSGQGGPAGNGRLRFELMPADNGKGRTFGLQTRPWQPADPKDRWRINLHPWAAGLRIDRISQHISTYTGNLINRPPETYASGPIDASPHGLLIPPPALAGVSNMYATSPTT